MKIKISLFCRVVALGCVLCFLICETFKSSKNHGEFEYLSLVEHLCLDKQESEKFNLNTVDGQEIVVNSKNDSLLLKDVITMADKPVLIIRYSSYGCASCIEYLLSKAMSLVRKINCGTKLMVAANVSVGDLHVIQNDYKDFIIYKSDSLFTDFDMALTPYMYFIDEDYRIQDYYIPRKEANDSVDSFFKYLETKYIR